MGFVDVPCLLASVDRCGSVYIWPVESYYVTIECCVWLGESVYSSELDSKDLHGGSCDPMTTNVAVVLRSIDALCEGPWVVGVASPDMCDVSYEA